MQTPDKVIDITARLARPASRSSEPAWSCATTLEQVEGAWRLVYERYSQMGLIDENPHAIHAVPTAVGAHACVLWGPGGDGYSQPGHGAGIGYTMTLFRDSSKGLALDSVYGANLDGLRREGRRLLEVGMLADRLRCAHHNIQALFGMMRGAIYLALHTGVSDIVVGVHPRHAGFYKRCYAFEQFAGPACYPMVRNNPVVPLRLRLLEQLAKNVLPRGLVDARDHHVPASAFAHRFAFEPEQLRGSRIAAFLRARYGMDPACGEPAARPEYGLAWSAA